MNHQQIFDMINCRLVEWKWKEERKKMNWKKEFSWIDWKWNLLFDFVKVQITVLTSSFCLSPFNHLFIHSIIHLLRCLLRQFNIHQYSIFGSADTRYSIQYNWIESESLQHCVCYLNSSFIANFEIRMDVFFIWCVFAVLFQLQLINEFQIWMGWFKYIFILRIVSLAKGVDQCTVYGNCSLLSISAFTRLLIYEQNRLDV